MEKKVKYVGLILLLLICGCGRQPKQETTEEEEIVETGISGQDSVEIKRLVTEYLDYLKDKNFDAALGMLSTIRHDSALVLTPEEIKKQNSQYQFFPVLSYHIDDYIIKGKLKTEVAYSIEFFEKTKDDTRPNKISFKMKCEKINDMWRLGILNR